MTGSRPYPAEIPSARTSEVSTQGLSHVPISIE